MWDHILAKLSGAFAEVVIALLNLFAAYGTQVQKDVPYAPGEPHRADIYRPDTGGARPVVVYLYGGGWRGGSKERAAYIGAALARRGYVVVLPEYRHFPAAGLSEILADNAAAVAWTVAHAAEFGGDPRHVIVAGGSSGAWAAAMLLLDPGWLERAGSGTGALAGMIGIAGPYAVSALNDRRDRAVFEGSGPGMEPLALASARHPPVLLLVGTADTDVRPDSTVALAERLRDLGGNVAMNRYPGFGHDGVIRALTFPFARGSSVPDDIDRFVEETGRSRSCEGCPR